MYKYVRYNDSRYHNDNSVNIIRWTDSDTSEIKNYTINLKDSNSRIRLLDMKDDLMIVYDRYVIYVVQSPNLTKFTIPMSEYMNVNMAFINDYDEHNKTLVVVTELDDNGNLMHIYDLNNGKLIKSIPCPYEDYGNLFYADQDGVMTRWGNYLVATMGTHVDYNKKFIWSYNMITDRLVFKDTSDSVVEYGSTTWNLTIPSLVPSSYSQTLPTAYTFLYIYTNFVIAAINLDTLEYTSHGPADAGESHIPGNTTYVGYSTEAGSNYCIFYTSDKPANRQVRRFNGTTYIDKTKFWESEVSPVSIVTREVVRTKGGQGDLLYMRLSYDGKAYLQQLTDTFLPVGDRINLTDEGIIHVGRVTDIFLSNYLFEGDIENPYVKYDAYNSYNNVFKFKITHTNPSESLKFDISKITWNGIELSFTNNETELILYGHESWETNEEYICEVEEKWTIKNSSESFHRYQDISTIVDMNGDGENDYDWNIVVPNEYYDTTNLKPYIEHRYRGTKTSTMLWNYYSIRIANPVVGGTPWYNFIGTTLNVNWRVKFASTGDIQQVFTKLDNVKNDGWSISSVVYIGVPNSYLDSSNRTTLIIEVETPTGEWISSDKFQINNYTNEYNYKWRFAGEDDDCIYFKLDGDYSITNEWYKPDYLYLYDGDERITSRMSNTISIVDGVATMKVSKSSYDFENIPKHGYWCHFRGNDYTLSSAPKGYGGVEKFEFTVKLQIRTTTISQYQFEVTQQNDKIYIANAYFTENVEVYKDGVKLECSYDKESGEIKFILPKDTPQELNGHTLNLQYKVFYNDNDEIKSFMQDFTYTTYASYFVELDPDFKDYYWEQLSPTHYGYNLYNGCMVSYGDYIYLVGTAYDNGYKKLLLRYNIESDTWTELASPEYDVYKTKPVVYNNKIYVVGGQTYSTWDRVTKVQIYDIETDSWSYGTDCPRNQGPHELQPIEYNGKIYCFSGYDYDYPSPPNKMDIYDIETDSWESIETPYNLKKYSASCIDGKIYICNGTDSNYNYITTLYIYDIEANTWTTGPDQPVATYGSSHGGGTMLDKFVVILGDFKESVKTMSFDYDISKNKWMRLPDAPNDLGYSYDNAKCCRNNNEFYVLKYQYFYRLIKAPVYYTDSYLYEYEGKYYTENENGELVETTTQELNEDLFLNEGVSYINSDLIKPNMKVLYFKAENKNEVPQLKYSGVYEGTTIIMDWDLQSEQGKTFNVLGDIYSDDNVRFLLSNDNGQTWKTFDGYEVVNCNIDNIKSNGMTYDIFTSLNASQLESFKGGTNSLRIAIYIEQYSVNGKTNIDHIRLRY